MMNEWDDRARTSGQGDGQREQLLLAAIAIAVLAGLLVGFFA